jgi:glycosyltransferase involved in cell wall biosynthesis
MKVLHLAAGNLFGGVETYLLTLARLRHLSPAMEPQFALCFPGRLRDELLVAKVPVHDLGAVRASRPWTVLRARWRLKRLLRKQAIDVAVTHGMWPHAVFGPAVRRSRVRLVTAIHDTLDARHWVNRWAARTRPDAIVTNSRFTAGPAATLFPGVRAEPVYLPVAPPVLDRAEARRAARAELGTPHDAVVILQASRLERWKGQAVHVEALGRLSDAAGWEVWFAGGPQKEGEAEFLAELKAAAERAGIAHRVKFLGQRADIPRLMAAADVYCQPNTGPEPFGVSFVEALYAGLPVVTSATGGALESVNDACGVLVKPNDVSAVADALRGLIVDAPRRRSLGAAGPARAAALCDPARQLAALADAVARGANEQR